MAQIANPRKQFNFSVFFAGMNPFLAQKVTIPEESVDVTEHGDTNFLVKTGGMKKVGKLVIEKIMFATAPENWVHNWMLEVQNTAWGGGLLPSLYYRNGIIEEYSTDGITVLNRWICKEAWPSQRGNIELSRTDSGNTMERLELEVNELYKQ
jgi:hypothetical protein